MAMSDGMKCYDCGRTHTEWEEQSEHAVNSGSHQGLVTRVECGNCGGMTEVGRR